jgi:hypothetical protein
MFQSAEANQPEGQIADTNERREWLRYRSESASEMTSVSSMSPPCSAKVIDVSKAGLCLQSELEVPCGGHVNVSLGETLIFGQVRWCRKLAERCFEVGVVIDYTAHKDLDSGNRSAVEPAPLDGIPDEPDH